MGCLEHSIAFCVLVLFLTAQSAAARATLPGARFSGLRRAATARVLLDDESKTDTPPSTQAVAAAGSALERSPTASAAAAIGTSSSATDNLAPLIPLPVLLGPSQFKSPQLSPNGRFLAYLAPSEESRVTSVFVAELPPSRGSSSSSGGNRRGGTSNSFGSASGSSDADVGVPLNPVQVTNTTAAVSDLFWARDGSGILFTIDSGSGTEDFQLHWVPLTFGPPSSSSGSSTSNGSRRSSRRQQSSGTSGGGSSSGAGTSASSAKPGTAVNLTPGKGVKAQGLWISYADPSRAFVGANMRTKSVFDFYSLDLRSYALALHTVNPGNVTSWVVTAAFDLGAAVMAGPDGSRTLLVRDPSTPDGCPPATTAAAATARGRPAPPGTTPAPTRSSATAQSTAATKSSAAGSPDGGSKRPGSKAGGQQQQQQVAAVAVSDVVGAPEQISQQQQQQQQVNMDGAPSRDGRRLVGLAEQRGSLGAFMMPSSEDALFSAVATAGSGDSGSDIVAAADSSGDGSSSGSSDEGDKGSGSDARGKAQDVAQAIDSSSSRNNVACWRRVYEWPLGDEGRVWGFNKAGDALYITTSVGRDTTELQLVSTSASKPGAVLERVASHPLVDVSDVVFDTVTRHPEALALDYHKPVWSFRSPKDQQDWDRLEEWRPGEVLTPVSRSKDKQVMILQGSQGHQNAAFYLHRRGTFPPQLLFYQQPSLSNYTLARTHPIVITARDGLRIPGYLTLPARSDLPTQLPAALAGPVPDFQAFNALQRTHSKPQQEPSQPQQGGELPAEGQKVQWGLPMVLLVHGGPWRRTTWGSNAGVTQWLANRGYAVLNVNFRGSTGYGKTFTYKGDRQWGVGSMQHDLSDAVAWAVQTGIADPKRVCIQGASYGGYATFAGLAFTPELYQCGVSFAGITDLASFVRAMPPWWAPIKNRFLHRVGNVTGNSVLNQRLSPRYHADDIRVPLLIGQGGNDVRVVQAEADAMFHGLKAQGNKQVQYVLYPNEGHSLTHLPNRLDYYSRAEQLLADVLGGRRDEVLRPSKSTAKVKTRHRRLG